MNVDTYLVADDKEAIVKFCAYFRNVIGPVKGIAATEAYTDEYGNEIAAQEAKGDPTKFYSCVRAPFAVTPVNGIEICDEETGISVCGVWA